MIIKIFRKKENNLCPWTMAVTVALSMYSLEKIVAVLVSRGSAAEISHDVAVSPQD